MVQGALNIGTNRLCPVPIVHGAVSCLILSLGGLKEIVLIYRAQGDNFHRVQQLRRKIDEAKNITYLF